jgi:hypothetical protein
VAVLAQLVMDAEVSTQIGAARGESTISAPSSAPPSIKR